MSGRPRAAAADSLRHFRQRAGLSQRQVARQLLVSVETVRRWETADRNPPLRSAAMLAQVLDLTDYDLGRLVRWWGGA